MQTIRLGSRLNWSNCFDHSLENGDMDFYIRRGYTFIISNPRGIGEGEGEFHGICANRNHAAIGELPFCAGSIHVDRTYRKSAFLFQYPSKC